MKEVKPKRLAKTVKEKKFVAAYLETGNATQAVIDAGYDAADRLEARKIGHIVKAKLDMEEYFEAAGLTKETLAQNTARIALTAKKQNQFTGEIDDDNAIQLRAMDQAAKLVSWYAPPRAAVDNEGNTVVPILMALDVYGDDGD